MIDTHIVKAIQSREPIEETDYTFAGRIDENQVVLGGEKLEVWTLHDDFAGYVVVIDGKGYKFVRDALQGDLWWSGMTRL